MAGENNDDTAMEGLGGNCPSLVLSAATVTIVNKFRKKFEEITTLKLSSELEESLTKCITETIKDIQSDNAATSDVDTARPQGSEQLEEIVTPSTCLVFQFDGPENGCVTMAMMKNGKPEVVKNEEGFESTPAFAGFIDGKGFVYGTASKEHKGPGQVGWPNFMDWKTQSVDLKELGCYNLPSVFFTGFLIRKLKIAAEAGCDDDGAGSFCRVAILAVPMYTDCLRRCYLKYAAILAGFEDSFAISAEGLAAYYWFHEKEAEMEQKNYSKDTVIIDLFGDAVVFRKSFECENDGKRILVVKAVILLSLVNSVDVGSKAKLGETFKKKCELLQTNGVIPIIGRQERSSEALGLTGLCSIQAAVVEDDEYDKFEYFAAKGAALLRANPKNIGRQIRNMIGIGIQVVSDRYDILTLPDKVLPETSVKLALNIKHDRTKYKIHQYLLGRSHAFQSGPLTWNLHVDGVGLDLKVTFELSWEGLWKVVEVSGRNPSADGDGYESVKWRWSIYEDADLTTVDRSSLQDCQSLLLKVAPSPSQETVLAEDGYSTELLNTLDEAAVAPECSGTSSNGHRSGRKERKQKSAKSRVIRPNDIIVNTGSKKIKLESDWVEPVVKIEQDSMEDCGGDGNGQQGNLMENGDVEVEEGEVKIEIV